MRRAGHTGWSKAELEQLETGKPVVAQKSEAVAMADMNDPANIRQAMDATAATTKIALFFAVAFALLFLWKRAAFNFGIACLWAAIGILGMFVHRARKKRLKELDSD